LSAGDLDNFITGICDGLQAAHRRTLIVAAPLVRRRTDAFDPKPT
jgi:hypothetical protein